MVDQARYPSGQDYPGEGVSLASVATSVWHGATGRAAAHARGAQATVLHELELARAAQKAVALAQQDKSAWTRADLIKYLGRVLPRTGRDPAAAAALLQDLADRALRLGVRTGHLPGSARAGRGAGAACGAPTDAASTSGTAVSGTPPTRSWPWKNACSRKPRADGAPRVTRAQAARALGADLARLEDALAGRAYDADETQAARDAQDTRTGSGLREDQAAAALAVLTDGRLVSVINAPASHG